MRAQTIAMLTVLSLCAAACSPSAEEPGGTEQPSTTTTAAPPSSAPEVVGVPAAPYTVPKETAGATRKACPFLSDKDVMAINGQRAGATYVREQPPSVICVFTRQDNSYLASVEHIAAPDAKTATAWVNAAAPVQETSPASVPSGWKGGSWVRNDVKLSVYAVSSGVNALIGQSNQLQTIKPRCMVLAAAVNLALSSDTPC